MSTEYNLKFHEALKRAVEDGAQINARERGITFYGGEDPKIYGYNLSDLMPLSWRVIEKPKRVEFECRWADHHLSGVYPYGMDENIGMFVGKRTRVTIEEIL